MIKRDKKFRGLKLYSENFCFSFNSVRKVNIHFHLRLGRSIFLWYSRGENVDLNGAFCRCIPFTAGLDIGRYHFGTRGYNDFNSFIENLKWAKENNKLVKNAQSIS